MKYYLLYFTFHRSWCIESPNELLANGWTPVYIAAEKGHPEVVKVLASTTENPNSPAANGITPIYIAAIMGHTEVVKILALITENPNAPVVNGFTPIYVAAQKGHSEIDKFLAFFLKEEKFRLLKDQKFKNRLQSSKKILVSKIVLNFF